MYYGEAPGLYQDTTLGQAVVASVCVPGLFEPVRLDRA
jgi:predicted acylesterase/phospholipase RssA